MYVELAFRLSGVKIWGVACWSGFCSCGFTNGGFIGDPRLREWATCPLGRTTRMVLIVLFHACPTLGRSLL